MENFTIIRGDITFLNECIRGVETFRKPRTNLYRFRALVQLFFPSRGEKFVLRAHWRFPRGVNVRSHGVYNYTRTYDYARKTPRARKRGYV